MRHLGPLLAATLLSGCGGQEGAPDTPATDRGARPEAPAVAEPEEEPPQGPSGGLLLWLAEGLALSHEQQLQLAERVGEAAWSYDTTLRRLDFEDRASFPAQLLGSESHASGTWLWAWANEQSALPPEVTALSRQLRRLGDERGIPELTTPQLALAPALSAALLAAAAAGTLPGVRAWYRGPTDHGAAWLLIDDPDDLELPAPTTARTLRVLTEVLANLPRALPALDHGVLVRSYLARRGFLLTEDGPTLRARHPDGANVEVEFDPAGRIATMRGHA